MEAEKLVERTCCLATTPRGRRIFCVQCVGVLITFAGKWGNAAASRAYGVHENTIARLRRRRD